MIKQTLIEAYEATVEELDTVLGWCYPMPRNGRMKEANFTVLFTMHALRILNKGVFQIKDPMRQAFPYFEAPIQTNTNETKKEGEVDAIIADWKDSVFVAIESKGTYTAHQRKQIESQVGRLVCKESRQLLAHRFDWPKQCDPLNVWLVVMAGFWGRVNDGEVLASWAQQLDRKSVV